VIKPGFGESSTVGDKPDIVTLVQIDMEDRRPPYRSKLSMRKNCKPLILPLAV